MITEDRRRFPRIDSINLAYLYLDKKFHITDHGTGKTINISEEGLLIETDMEINSGHSIIALIELPENSVEIKGKIIHCQLNGSNKYIAGIRITEINGNGKPTWENFIDRLLNTNEIRDTD